MSATFRLPRIPRVVSMVLFPPALSLGAAAHRQWRRYTEARRQHRAMIVLELLSDGALKDIGVSRANPVDGAARPPKTRNHRLLVPQR